MELPPIDFESIVSTNFTTPAGKLLVVVYITLSYKKTQY